jgi:hypothetical protein
VKSLSSNPSTTHTEKRIKGRREGGREEGDKPPTGFFHEKNTAQIGVMKKVKPHPGSKVE